SILEYRLYCLVHSVLAGFWFSKFCTSQARSNLPWPRSLVSAVSQLPPRRPPLYRIGYLPCTPPQYDSGDPATMIGPNNSGRMAASITTAQPAWQLPITHGLPSA